MQHKTMYLKPVHNIHTCILALYNEYKLCDFYYYSVVFEGVLKTYVTAYNLLIIHALGALSNQMIFALYLSSTQQAYPRYPLQGTQLLFDMLSVCLSHPVYLSHPIIYPSSDEVRGWHYGFYNLYIPIIAYIQIIFGTISICLHILVATHAFMQKLTYFLNNFWGGNKLPTIRKKSYCDVTIWLESSSNVMVYGCMFFCSHDTIL